MRTVHVPTDIRRDSFPKRSIVLLQGVFEPRVFDHLKEKRQNVFVLEGRPHLEAARNSCQQLRKRKIMPTLISDNMAGFLFFQDWVKEIWVSYQEVAQDGALCNVGALILGILGKRHRVPLYLFPGKPGNKFIGDAKEILYFQGKRVAPLGMRGYAPLVEWLPRKYITKIASV